MSFLKIQKSIVIAYLPLSPPLSTLTGNHLRSLASLRCLMPFTPLHMRPGPSVLIRRGVSLLIRKLICGCDLDSGQMFSHVSERRPCHAFGFIPRNAVCRIAVVVGPLRASNGEFDCPPEQIFLKKIIVIANLRLLQAPPHFDAEPPPSTDVTAPPEALHTSLSASGTLGSR